MKTVTVMGESAGAGSIMYHLTSPEISSQSLFQRGIVQSPYTYPISNWQQEQTMRQVLQMSNVSSLSELQDLPSESLQTINGMVVGSARPYGTFVFGECHRIFITCMVSLTLERYKLTPGGSTRRKRPRDRCPYLLRVSACSPSPGAIRPFGPDDGRTQHQRRPPLRISIHT